MDNQTAIAKEYFAIQELRRINFQAYQSREVHLVSEHNSVQEKMRLNLLVYQEKEKELLDKMTKIELNSTEYAPPGCGEAT